MMSTENELIFDVIIVGCGAAGIGAGIELEKVPGEKNYLILEGRDRIGGRAFTDRTTFGQNTPVDHGAHYLCHQNEGNFLLQHYVPSENDFVESDVYDASTMKIFDENGQIVSDEMIEQTSEFTSCLLAEAMFATDSSSDRSIADFLHPHLADVTELSWRRLVDLYLTYTELHEGADLNKLSLFSYGKGEGGLNECDITLSNGFGTLVEEIASKYSLPIRLNSIVTKIDVNDQLVRVTTDDHRSYLTRYVLITIPLGCLKSNMIEFSPILPQWKSEAIERMGFGLLNRVYLQFSEIFWEENLRRISIATDRYKVYYCLPEHRLLILFLSGSQAEALEKMSDDEIVEAVIHSLRRVYSQTPKPIKWLITRWKSDRFSQGSYSNFSIGANEQTVKYLATETHEGHVHWAGEHTNIDGCIGYVDSGFESGLREGKKIRDKLQSFR